MKKLLIVGAGGFGREVLTLALDNPKCRVEWQIAGYLDSRRDILKGFASDFSQIRDAAQASDEVRALYRRDYPVLGDPLQHEPQPDEVFVCALGDPAHRLRYAQPLLDKGAVFISLVHPRAAVSAYSTIAPGCIIGPFAALSPDAHLDAFVTVNSYSAVSHDVRVGPWTEIGGHCLIAGGAVIGERVRIHPGSIVAANAQIGDGAVVAAGSVVFGKVPAATTVMGNPARRFDWKADPA
jgi:sugar O-acyltransferase (sialic acid O-acetyltransferase NeuD family)